MLAGTLRAEVTLAAANLIWLILLFAEGSRSRWTSSRPGLANVLQYLPSAALSDGLHLVLQDGSGPPVRALVTLLAGRPFAVPAAARWFRWE